MQLNVDKNAENPLIWPLWGLLRESQQSYKIHNLASELQSRGLLTELDSDANKALFKRNFLLMNALYQLQAMLLPEQWLQVEAMDIQLFTQLPKDMAMIVNQGSALRSYYLDWNNFDSSAESIILMLESFWARYQHHIGRCEEMLDKNRALQVFGLDSRASKQDIARQWRKLALKWHPDRASGNAMKFHQICEAWQILRLA